LIPISGWSLSADLNHQPGEVNGQDRCFFQVDARAERFGLHLMAGQPPALRIHGDIERVKYKVLDNDDLRAMLYEIASGRQDQSV
jgi:Tfp pilus assembly ATPase PilU